MGDSHLIAQPGVPIVVVEHVAETPDPGTTSETPDEETPYITGLGSLINEELAKVFSYLSQEERQKLRGVSNLWRTVIDLIFGMRTRVKNSTSDLIPTCPWAIEVELNSMTQPFTTGISFARTVRKMVFSNIVVTYNLVSFLRACSSITYLGFANIILDLPINDPWSQLIQENTTISLHNLEALEIKCFAFVEGIVEILNFLNDKVTFKRLKDVNINAQNPPVIPFQLLFQRGANPATIHPLIKLLLKIRPTLRKFSIGRSSLPTIMQFYPPKDPPVGINADDYPPQLEHLEIHPYFREEWSPILRSQTGIKIMDLGSCNVSRWAEIQESVISNSLALQSFTIGGLSFGQIWDCSVFQNCFNLRELSIEISHSNKINLVMLPLQLKLLHMFGPIQKQELVSIAETLVGLETLKFTHLGRIAEFNNAEEEKVTLEVFKSLLQLPNLKNLTFTTCSTISIDWDLVSLWCASVNGTPGFNYSEKYFQTHGEFFRNGISVEISDEFKRDTFDWSTAPLVTISEIETAIPATESSRLHGSLQSPGPDTPRG